MDLALSGLRKDLERNAVRARNGLKYLAGGEWAPIGPTPSDVIWQEGPSTLRRYRRDTPATLGPPVIAIGGFVGRAYIFDLYEGNSFVQRFLDAGFDVSVLDWGAPGQDDAANSLDTYLAGYFPRAIDALRRESGAGEVSLLGYCMGGSLALHALAGRPDLPVRCLLAMATPIDFAHMGELVDTLRDGRLDPASVLDDTGNVPAELLIRFFRVLKPTADLVQYANLWENLWNDEYMKGYQALGRCFREQVPMAGAAFEDIAEQWMIANGFVTDSLRLGGRPASMGDIAIPVLVVTASRDDLIPAEASDPLTGLLPGCEVDFLRLEAGHASLTTGRTAARETVPKMIEWLVEHSDEGVGHGGA